MLKLKLSSSFTSYELLHLQLQPALAPSGTGLSPPRFRKAVTRERERERGRQAYRMYGRILVLRFDNVCSAEGRLINGYWNMSAMDGWHCYGCMCRAVMSREGRGCGEIPVETGGMCRGSNQSGRGGRRGREGGGRRAAKKSIHLAFL